VPELAAGRDLQEILPLLASLAGPDTVAVVLTGLHLVGLLLGGEPRSFVHSRRAAPACCSSKSARSLAARHSCGC
jgi:hypothetical protein